MFRLFSSVHIRGILNALSPLLSGLLLSSVLFSGLLLSSLLLCGLLLSWPVASAGGIPDRIEFGGPDGVYEELINDYELRASDGDSDAFDDSLKPYQEYKNQLKKNDDLMYGFKAYWLYQNASKTLGDEDEALGQIYRFQGSWTFLGQGSGNPGRLEWRVEHRSGVGGRLSPTQLGDELGAEVLNPGFGYSPDFDTDLSVFNWTQIFNEHTAGFAIGRLAFDVYLDGFPFQTFSRGFINQAFIFSPTMAGTGIGALGAVAKGFVSDNLWLGGHIYDGNAVSGKFDIDTFNQHEWLKAVEIGWAPSPGRRKTDRLQFTYWQKNALEQAGISSGQGWVVSSSWKFDEFFPFVRFGHSDGGAGVLAKDAVSAGFEYTFRPGQAWNFGLGWANPVKAGVKDEHVVETSYQYQVLKRFSLLLNVQLLLDPANNPEQDQVWVTGLRGIMTL